MAKQRKSAYGGPAEEKEVVIALDKRILIGLGLVLVFGGAMAFGVWSAGGGATPVADTGGLSVPDAEAGAKARQEAELRALGLNPDTVTIIGESGGAQVQPVDPSQSQPPSAPEAVMSQPETSAGSSDVIRAVPDAAGIPDDAKSLGGQQFEVNPDRPSTENWTHDVLANFEDPNVTKAEFAPVRTEDVTEPLSGPRLGISDLNTLYTYDFGLASMTEVVQHDFTAMNVGDEDLLIARVYTGCGCTATRLADTVLDAAGWVLGPDGTKQPYVLAPGETANFSVEFDPRAEGKPGAMAKYIQIFSNDPTKAAFDGADPNSHETRFRIVVEPSYAYDPDAAGADQ